MIKNSECSLRVTHHLNINFRENLNIFLFAIRSLGLILSYWKLSKYCNVIKTMSLILLQRLQNIWEENARRCIPKPRRVGTWTREPPAKECPWKRMWGDVFPSLEELEQGQGSPLPKNVVGWECEEEMYSQASKREPPAKYYHCWKVERAGTTITWQTDK